MKISHFNHIMIELCYFSLHQWEIKIHLLWGKCFNIPHWLRSHLTNGRLQHIEDLSKSSSLWPSFRPNQIKWLIALDNCWCPWVVPIISCPFFPVLLLLVFNILTMIVSYFPIFWVWSRSRYIPISWPWLSINWEGFHPNFNEPRWTNMNKYEWLKIN